MAQHEKTHSKRIWDGDPETVVEARKLYEKDHANGLIPYAVALYSFRANSKLGADLVCLYEPLLQRAITLVSCDVNLYTCVWFADSSDVLCTHLEWIRRKPYLAAETSEKILTVVKALAEKACLVCDEYLMEFASKRQFHTRRLLYLTRARLYLDNLDPSKNDVPQARMMLREASEDHAYVQDANQRVRVWAKLGFLYRKSNCTIEGLSWGIRACLISGVPMNVRKKAIAALLLIDL
jgi:hypothetical protein